MLSGVIPLAEIALYARSKRRKEIYEHVFAVAVLIEIIYVFRYFVYFGFGRLVVAHSYNAAMLSETAYFPKGSRISRAGVYVNSYAFIAKEIEFRFRFAVVFGEEQSFAVSRGNGVHNVYARFGYPIDVGCTYIFRDKPARNIYSVFVFFSVIVGKNYFLDSTRMFVRGILYRLEIRPIGFGESSARKSVYRHVVNRSYVVVLDSVNPIASVRVNYIRERLRRKLRFVRSFGYVRYDSAIYDIAAAVVDSFRRGFFERFPVILFCYGNPER